MALNPSLFTDVSLDLRHPVSLAAFRKKKVFSFQDVFGDICVCSTFDCNPSP